MHFPSFDYYTREIVPDETVKPIVVEEDFLQVVPFVINSPRLIINKIEILRYFDRLNFHRSFISIIWETVDLEIVQLLFEEEGVLGELSFIINENGMGTKIFLPSRIPNIAKIVKRIDYPSEPFITSFTSRAAGNFIVPMNNNWFLFISLQNTSNLLS